MGILIRKNTIRDKQKTFLVKHQTVLAYTEEKAIQTNTQTQTHT